MKFTYTRKTVKGRGVPPVVFLEELVNWGKSAPDELFAPNTVQVEAYTVIKPALATETGKDAAGAVIRVWDSLLHRKAAMLELMRVHAGMESSWNWNEGVDRTNRRSMANKTGEETGAFQVSFDSTLIDKSIAAFAKKRGLLTPVEFIPAMKQDHALAMEYYVRLVRVSIAWAGPLIRTVNDSVYPSLNKQSMQEFMTLLS